MTINQSYLIILFLISFTSFYFVKKNYQLTSLFFFSAFGQIIWLFYRILADRQIAVENFLYFGASFLISFKLLKTFFLYYTQNPNEISNIQLFFEILYKKPFLLLHENLMLFPFYKKFVFSFAFIFKNLTQKKKQIFFLGFIIVPFFCTISILLYEIFYHSTIHVTLIFFGLNFLIYKIIIITIYYIYEYHQYKIDLLNKNTINTEINTVETQFLKCYTPKDLGMLWPVYLKLMYHYGQLMLLYNQEKQLIFYKELTLELYFFVINSLFLFVILPQWNICYWPFANNLWIYLFFSLYTLYIQEKERQKTIRTHPLESEILKLNPNFI